MDTVLFIDGRNTAYRAYYAAQNNDKPINYFVVWMRFASSWINKFRPVSLHVFWDCDKNDIWRKKIYKEYKDNRDEQDPSVKIAVDNIQNTARAILPYMNTHNYIRDDQEADDLIYSACKVLHNNNIVIVSSDSDMHQLQWSMQNVSVYDPNCGKIVDTPEANPVVIKALAGDKTDNIDGYRGIGEVKSGQMARDIKLLVEFLNLRGEQEFRKNLVLIDLSLNPKSLLNQMYIIKELSKDIIFSKPDIDKLIIEHKIAGLTPEYPNLIGRLKNLLVS